MRITDSGLSQLHELAYAEYPEPLAPHNLIALGRSLDMNDVLMRPLWTKVSLE